MTHRTLNLCQIPNAYTDFRYFCIKSNCKEMRRIQVLSAPFKTPNKRLAGWCTNKIWSKSLVWILVAANASFILGFALKALSITTGISPFLSVHAFTAGGVGLLAIGMMSRAALRHTDRNV